MTRLERASLDYAIACLADGQRPESLSHLTEIVSGDAYSRAVQEVAEAQNRELGGVRRASWAAINCARRIVRARLALYLRIVRRVEAWERYERWARPRGVFVGVRVVITPRSGGTHDAWHPSWLDAPAHEPGVTARQRRERRCEEK